MMTPEHLHLALNHVPFLGAGFALVPLVIGFLTKQKQTVVAGLVIAAASGWVTPIVMATGESAYERYEDGPVARFLDPQAESVLEVHEHRAEAWSIVMYAGAVVSTTGLALMIWFPRRVRPISGTVSFFCLASVVAGAWVASSGGPIRRPDFRDGEAVSVSVPVDGRVEHRENHD